METNSTPRPRTAPPSPVRAVRWRWYLLGGAVGAYALLAVGTQARARVPGPIGPGTAVRAALVPPTFFGGIQVNEPDHDRWVDAVAEAGLDSIEVTLYARQQRWDEAELWYEREAPWVVSEIRAAKRAGLRVVLVMRVALEHGLSANRHLWHGMIWPRDDQLELWMQRYRDFVLWGAGMAAREGVDLLAVGNELSSLASTLPVQQLPDLYAYWIDPERVAAVRSELVRCAAQVMEEGRGDDLVQLDGGRYRDLEAMLGAEEQVRRAWVHAITGGNPRNLGHLNARRGRYERFWRRLISAVRDMYGGGLTYGANFDQYDQVGFWDALEYVGVNAYFPLGLYGLESESRVPRMEQAWRRIGERLASVVPSRPTILLELGWTRWLGSTVRPYSYSRVEVLETAAEAAPEPDSLTCVHWATQPTDASERVAALQALSNVVQAGAFDTLRGFILWKLTTQSEHRAIEPFAVLLQPGSGYTDLGWQSTPVTDEDALDNAYLALAARVGDTIRTRLGRVDRRR